MNTETLEVVKMVLASKNEDLSEKLIESGKISAEAAFDIAYQTDFSGLVGIILNKYEIPKEKLFELLNKETELNNCDIRIVRHLGHEKVLNFALDKKLSTVLVTVYRHFNVSGWNKLAATIVLNSINSKFSDAEFREFVVNSAKFT
jgi:hypothetical protein